MAPARLAILRFFVGAAIVAGIGASVRDGVAILVETPAAARAAAWTESHAARVSRALAGFEPAYAAIMAHVPRDGALCGWVTREVDGIPDLFDLMRIMIAPRVCVPLRGADEIPGPILPLVAEGVPTFAIEIHPAFASMVPRAEPLPGFATVPGAWRVLVRTSDFTLHGFSGGRSR